MTETILADAQFSVARIFKPFDGFEDVYQDVDGRTPIALPGTLDPDADKQGFDSNLISGIPVPYGARLSLWIPTLFRIESGIGIISSEYEYRFVWRLRNLRDFRENKSAYHFPRQSRGEDDEFVIPSAKKVTMYESSKLIDRIGNNAAAEATQCISDISSDVFVPKALQPTPPLSPRGEDAALQQGLGAAATNTEVTFNSVQIDCEGDELIICIYKPEASGDWDFEGDDKAFTDFYGIGSGKNLPDLGVYVFSGSNP